MKFLDVKTDYAFKKVFGSNQSHDILISFLNSILHFKDNLKIKSLEIVDPYNIPMIKGMKESFVDVKARLDDDSAVIIEMQVLNHQGFEKRVLYNAAKNYSIQLKQASDYHLLNPVIALSIVDFIMFEDSQQLISNFKLLEKEQFIHYSDDIELIFIELPKFNKNLSELQSLQEKWIYFIQNAGNLDSIPEQIEKEIKHALDIANEANFSAEELEIQQKRKEFIYIQKSSIDLAKERGMEQGLQEGLQEGLQKGIEKGMEKGIEKGLVEGIEAGEKKALLRVVENAYQNGLDIAVICQISGLNQKEVLAVVESMKK